MYRKIKNPATFSRAESQVLDSLLEIYLLIAGVLQNRIETASINPAFGDSVASGDLRDSFRTELKRSGNIGRLEMNVFTTQKHYDHIDNPAESGLTNIPTWRVKQWLSDRFGISPGTPAEAEVSLPGSAYGPIRYDQLVFLLRRKINARLADKWYQPLRLTALLEQIIRSGRMEVLLTRIFNTLLRTRTMEPV